MVCPKSDGADFGRRIEELYALPDELPESEDEVPQENEATPRDES